MYNGFYFKPLSSSLRLICILRLSMLRIAEFELSLAPALPLPDLGLLFLFFAIKHLPTVVLPIGETIIHSHPHYAAALQSQQKLIKLKSANFASPRQSNYYQPIT